MGIDVKTLALAKKNTQESLEGNGSIQGNPGKDGKDGKDAPTITSVSVDENNALSTTLSDGTVLPSGTIKTVSGKDGLNGQNGVTPHIDPTTKHWFIGTTDTSIVAEGKDGIDGIQGLRGEQGLPGLAGQQGIQGVKGDKGDDGYPFLIYKEYTSLTEFNATDFPQIGLMFMIKTEDATSFPVYRYTGETENPYSFVTNLSGSEGIKGDRGEKGDQGEQGVAGTDGKDGTTYQPTIGTVTSGDTVSASVEIDEDEKTAKFSFVLPKGVKGDTGDSGNDGQNGQNGTTPHIDTTSKHWMIGDTDTGVVAEGSDGQDGKDGSKGDKGDTPYIGANGNWWYGDKDSGVPIPSIMDLLKYVDGIAGISDTPVGHILSYMGKTAPNHYLICDGGVYNIADYPYLAQHIQNEFGSVKYFGGDGNTTFAVPDLRGEFLRGTGVNSHANQGSGDAVGIHQDATQHTNVRVAGSNNIIVGGRSVGFYPGGFDTTIASGGGRRWVGTPNSANDENIPFGYTSRPTNTSVLYCIKCEPTYYVAVNDNIGSLNG